MTLAHLSFFLSFLKAYSALLAEDLSGYSQLISKRAGRLGHTYFDALLLQVLCSFTRRLTSVVMPVYNDPSAQ